MAHEVQGTVWVLPQRYFHPRIIGNGAYGTVAAAFDTGAAAQVAIKRLNKPYPNPGKPAQAHCCHGTQGLHLAGLAKRTLRELKILR